MSENNSVRYVIFKFYRKVEKRAKILMFFGPQKLNNKYSAESVENSRNIPTYIGDHFVQFFRSVNPNFIVIFVER